jgi:Zn-dependent peptidase ImmA (M78 family)
MGLYDKLVNHAEENGIIVIEKHFTSQAKGLCKNNRIGISKAISKESEKACILAEELGHYFTTTGDITNQRDLGNQKQEKTANKWSQYQLIPLDQLIACYYHGCHDRYTTAEYLGVTEPYLELSIAYYHEKYGVCTVVGNHVIYFDPLGVMKVFG